MVRTGEDGPKGISCLVIEKDMPGVCFGAQEKKLGWRSQPTAQVNFDDVRVPVDNRVGDEGEGFRIAMMGLDGGRLNIGACSLGGAQRALDEAQRYTAERRQFGRPHRRFPEHCSSSSPTWRPSWRPPALLLYMRRRQGDRRRARQDPVRRHGQALRHRRRLDVVNQALQMHGGYGYLKDYPLERIVRDLRVHQILEGTNEIMRVIIAREMMKQ